MFSSLEKVQALYPIIGLLRGRLVHRTTFRALRQIALSGVIRPQGSQSCWTGTERPHYGQHIHAVCLLDFARTESEMTDHAVKWVEFVAPNAFPGAIVVMDDGPVRPRLDTYESEGKPDRWQLIPYIEAWVKGHIPIADIASVLLIPPHEPRSPLEFHSVAEAMERINQIESEWGLIEPENPSPAMISTAKHRKR